MLKIRQMHVQTILINSKLTNIFSITEKLGRNAKKKNSQIHMDAKICLRQRLKQIGM